MAHEFAPASVTWTHNPGCASGAPEMVGFGAVRVVSVRWAMAVGRPLRSGERQLPDPADRAAGVAHHPCVREEHRVGFGMATGTQTLNGEL